MRIYNWKWFTIGKLIFTFSDCYVYNHSVLIKELQLLQELGLKLPSVLIKELQFLQELCLKSDFRETKISMEFLKQVVFYCKFFEKCYTKKTTLFNREVDVAWGLHMKLHPAWYRTFALR